MPKVRVKNGPNKGLVYPVGDEVITLGRDASSTIQVLDKGASRNHSEIYKVGGLSFIRDLKSRNATYLNGEKIDEELLRPGDKVQIGSTVLEYESDGEDSKESPEIDLSSGGPAGEDDVFHQTLEIRVDDLHWIDSPDPKSSTAGSKQFEALFLASRAVAEETDKKTLINRMLDLVYQHVPADHIYVYLRDDASGKLVPRGRLERDPSKEVKVSRTIIQRALKDRKAILTSDAMADSRFKANQSIIVNRIRSVMCVPMEARGKAIGVLYLQSDQGKAAFSHADLELITAVGVQIAIGVQGLKAERTWSEKFIGSLRALVSALEAGTDRAGAAGRAAAYSAAVADAMGLSPEERMRAEMTALLHNLTAACRPDGHAAEADTDVDRAMAASRIAAAMPEAEAVAAAIRGVHERYDGAGKPDGLKGTDIPLAARIVAVALAFDRNTHKTGDAEEGIRLLKEMSGAIDPDVLQGLVTAHRSGTLMTPQP
jgi:HD-GYP domain-containing protein (c-di-GMP phosphodiesterase class II)/pSer/pThr/pTyr-binding forkhead associated (FHA) protein